MNFLVETFAIRIPSAAVSIIVEYFFSDSRNASSACLRSVISLNMLNKTGPVLKWMIAVEKRPNTKLPSFLRAVSSISLQ